ncbi:MAG: ion transporter [Opitutae bacterium]|nr:ion transporter [Opitutae bacterium]
MYTFCSKITKTNLFDNFIIGIILFAGLLVGVQTYKEFANRHIEILTFLDSIVLAIFTLEAVIKILAEGKRPINYFRNAWNVFDFLIVTVCLMEPLLPLDAEFLPVLRLARILRVLRLVTVVPKLQLIVGTLLKSIPSMFYVCILLFLLFYMYGAMGVFLYGDNDPIHFRNLQTALLSLFRVTTLEDWTDVMYINMYGSDNYGYTPEDLARWTPVPTASPLGAAFFFVSFVLIGTMVVLNLVIGVIMNSMDEMNAEMALNERIKLRRELEDPIREGMEDFHERFLELNEEIQVIKKLIQKERKS